MTGTVFEIQGWHLIVAGIGVAWGLLAAFAAGSRVGWERCERYQAEMRRLKALRVYEFKRTKGEAI